MVISIEDEDISRSVADKQFFEIGERIRGGITKRPMPSYCIPKGLKGGALGQFVKRPKLKEDDEIELQSDKKINSAFRARWKNMDEVISTASVREMVKGMLSDGAAELTMKEWNVLTEIIDLISSIRMETIYTGFATRDNVMQHPANRENAIIADPFSTAKEHARMDNARRTYILRAMEKVEDEELDAIDQTITLVKAGIEFHLNYFAAPVTADNVMPFTRRAKTPLVDSINQDQVAARERLKEIYVQIGGKLRAPKRVETREQSQRRDWQSDLSRGSDYAHAPPSPRRFTTDDIGPTVDGFDAALPGISINNGLMEDIVFH